MIDQLIVTAVFGATTLALVAALTAALIDVWRGGASRSWLTDHMQRSPVRTASGAILFLLILFFCASGLSGTLGGPSIFR